MWDVGLKNDGQYSLTIIECLLIIILNAVEIDILRKKTNKKVHEMMLLSLSICELQNAIVTTIFMFVIKVMDSHGKRKTVVLWLMVVWCLKTILVTGSSMLHLIFISFHRMWAIIFPVNHRRYATNKKVRIAIMLSWLVPILLMLVYSSAVLIGRGFHIGKIMHFLSGPGFSLTAIAFVATDIILITSYLVIAVVLSKSTLNAKGIHENSTKNQQQMNILYLCIGMVSSFIISTAPFVVVALVQWNPPDWLLELSNIMSPMNGAVNSVIFLIQHYRQNRSVVSRNDNLTSKTMKNVLEN